MKEPVFCKKCKYYKRESFYGGYTGDFCIYKINEEPYNTPYGIEYRRENPIPEKHNANNDCPYYKDRFFIKLTRWFT